MTVSLFYHVGLRSVNSRESSGLDRGLLLVTLMLPGTGCYFGSLFFSPINQGLESIFVFFPEMQLCFADEFQHQSQWLSVVRKDAPSNREPPGTLLSNLHFPSKEGVTRFSFDVHNPWAVVFPFTVSPPSWFGSWCVSGCLGTHCFVHSCISKASSSAWPSKRFLSEWPD